MTSTPPGSSEPDEERPLLSATPEAEAMVRSLEDEHGPLAIFQSGGCCDGSLPICLRAGELPPSPHDLLLGEVAGTPVYVDGEQYSRWREPAILIDVAAGEPEGLSLGLSDRHLISR